MLKKIKFNYNFIGGISSVKILILKIIGSVLNILTMSLIIPISSLLFNVGSLLDNIDEKNIKYVDDYIKTIDEKQVVLIFGLIIFSYAVFSFFIRRYIIKKFANYIVEIRFKWVLQLSKHFYGLNISELNNEKEGSLVSSWYNDSYHASVFLNLFFVIIEHITFISIFVLSIFYTSLYSGIILTITISIGLFGYFKLKNRDLNIQSNKKVKSTEQIMSHLTDFIMYIRDLKIYFLYKNAKKSIYSSTNNLSKVLIKNRIDSKFPQINIETGVIILLSIFTCLVGLKIFDIQNINKPLLFFNLAAGYKSLGYFSQILSSFAKLKNDYKSFKNIRLKITNSTNINLENNNTLNFNISKIIIKNLKFSWENNVVLFDDVNLEIPLKKHILFTSNSGSGKSTFLDVISGLNNSYKGEVYLEDSTGNKYESKSSYYSYVCQSVGLFGSNIKNCICGSNEFDKQNFKKVIDICNLNSVIKHSDLKSDFSNLSGGERIRVALARALYYNRPILILDESLSSVEHKLEMSILNNIKKTFKNITIIHVAHKRGNIENIDLLMKIENKKITINNI